MEYIIIVAGGKGLRMGSDIPKQFLPICGKPVLMRTIERFREYSKDIHVILVLPKAQQKYWANLCDEYRFHSVRNGLSLIPDNAEGTVGVHDGVRPFPSVEVISRCYEVAQTAKAVIPVTQVVETLRHVEEKRNVLRSDYRLVQTPQVFDIQTLKEAYRQEYKDSFTDDASVVESIGREVTMVEGNRENIKITTPFDIKIAESILR